MVIDVTTGAGAEGGASERAKEVKLPFGLRRDDAIMPEPRERRPPMRLRHDDDLPPSGNIRVPRTSKTKALSVQKRPQSDHPDGAIVNDVDGVDASLAAEQEVKRQKLLAKQSKTKALSVQKRPQSDHPDGAVVNDVHDVDAGLAAWQEIKRQKLLAKQSKQLTDLEAKQKAELAAFEATCSEEQLCRCAYCSTIVVGVVEKTKYSFQRDIAKTTCCFCKLTRKCKDCKWNVSCRYFPDEHGFCNNCANEAYNRNCWDCDVCSKCQPNGCCRYNHWRRTGMWLP